MENLSSPQIRYFRELFDLINKDSEMSITYKELGTVFRVLGTNPTELELQDMINAADQDGNGSVDFFEFTTQLVLKMCDTDHPDELRDAFKILDRDNNGWISASDLRHIYISLGMKISDDEIDELIREADLDLDGVISLEEFTNMMICE